MNTFEEKYKPVVDRYENQEDISMASMDDACQMMWNAAIEECQKLLRDQGRFAAAVTLNKLLTEVTKDGSSNTSK